MRGGPRGFRPGFPCPVVLRFLSREATHFRVRGLYPLWRRFPPSSTNAVISYSPTALRNDQDKSYNPGMETPAGYRAIPVWAIPVSLATTQGIEVSFLSSGYLDVSVRRLTFSHPMCSGGDTRALPRVGFPIRRPPDQRLVSSSPGHIAAAHVLHRLQMPRHPPCALRLLI